MSIRQNPRRRYFVAVLAFFAIVLYVCYLPTPSLHAWRHQELEEDLPCKRLPGAEDVLVVMKTGATEIRQKLPIHFKTTLRCIPHYAVFSDLEDDIEGHHINDTLDELSQLTTTHYPEFEFYRTLKAYQSKGKNITELLDRATNEEDNGRKAWDLDKWKFLPLMEKALKTKPDAKWFVMVEADTYLMWSNLLLFLETLDPTKPYYIGGQTWGGDVEFAHGGSGIVLSNPALWKLVRYQMSNREHFEDITGDDWAGDRALSRALEKVDIRLTEAWPMFQGETPTSLDYTDRHFCSPTITYHHINPSWIQQLWEFEQAWIYRNLREDHPRKILHRHIFAHFVLPKISAERTHWSNLSPIEHPAFTPATLDHCRQLCRQNPLCMQYSFHPRPGVCKTAHEVRLGALTTPDIDPAEASLHELRSAEARRVLSGSTTPTSGWVLERVRAFQERHGECGGEWIRPRD